MHRSIIYTILGILLICGCVGKGPTREELAGTWLGADSASIKLTEDGAIYGKNLPSSYFNQSMSRQYGDKFDGNGMWKFNEQRSRELLLTFLEMKFDSVTLGRFTGLRIHAGGTGSSDPKQAWRLYLWENPGDKSGAQFSFKKE